MTHGTLALTRTEQRQFGLWSPSNDEDQELDVPQDQVWCTECETWTEAITVRDMFGATQTCANCGAEL